MVETAENGEIGGEKARCLKRDLILLDMHMPIMDEYTAIQVLRKQHYTKPVCALTVICDGQRYGKIFRSGM